MGIFHQLATATLPFVPRPVMRKLAGRYIAGETLEEAMDRLQNLQDQGFTGILDLLGEDVQGEAEAREVLAALLQGRKPRVPTYSVCVECKRRGTTCVAVAHHQPCLGPVTQAGCGALCPTYNRGCYGCFGPDDTPNTAALADRLRAHGMAEAEVMRFFRTFNAGAEPFRVESMAHEQVTS